MKNWMRTLEWKYGLRDRVEGTRSHKRRIQGHSVWESSNIVPSFTKATGKTAWWPLGGAVLES